MVALTTGSVLGQNPRRRAALSLAIAVVLVGSAASFERFTQPGRAVPGPGVCTAPARGRTERVNVGSGRQQANGATFGAAISANGRLVAFSSEASNLVASDRNTVSDVFVHDLLTGQTSRVSVSSKSREGNGASAFPSISGDGRFVAFRSVASNLVRGDRNGLEDVFVHDRASGLTERVSVGASGQEANGPSFSNNISGDGRLVAFSSPASNLTPVDTNGVQDVFVRDRLRHRTVLVSVGSYARANASSEGSSISVDGRLVVFRSFASNLVPGDTNEMPDIFVRNRLRGITRRVNVSSSGAQANAETFRGVLSPEGRFIGFRSRADNLVPGDTNDALDVFVRDLRTGTTHRISRSSNGAQAAAGGFDEHARDNLFMSRPFLSASGMFVAFTSRAANLVPSDTNRWSDVFVRDRRLGTTVRVSLGSSGRQPNSNSFAAGTSTDGRVVAFWSYANNLIRDDTNRRRDLFVRLRGLGVPCSDAS